MRAIPGLNSEGLLRGFTCRNVLNSGDVNKGAFGATLGESMGIEFNADFHRVWLYERNVVIDDVEWLAVWQANAERSKRLRVHAFFEAAGIYHGVSLSFTAEISTKFPEGVHRQDELES
jgi:hypothetical protein